MPRDFEFPSLGSQIETLSFARRPPRQTPAHIVDNDELANFCNFLLKPNIGSLNTIQPRKNPQKSELKTF